MLRRVTEGTGNCEFTVAHNYITYWPFFRIASVWAFVLVYFLNL